MSSRRKRSRVDGEDDGNDADADADAVEATNQNSGGEGNQICDVDDDIEFFTGGPDDDSYRDDETVDTVDSCVDGITEGDGLEIEEPLSIEHWRGMELDSDTNKFRFVGSNNKEAAKDIPEADQYKKIRPRDTKRVRVSFANARQCMVSILKDEYDELFQTLDELSIPKTIDGIYERLFGEDSRLVQTLCRELSMEHYHVYKFLATFYFAAELGKPPKQLQDHPNIKYNDYMDEASLNAIWRKIAVAGKDGKSTYFWQAVETALNEDCRDLFLRSSNSRTGRTAKNKLRIALDDDKVHFQFKTLSVKRDKNHLCGMGGQMHARSGVKGMTIDSAVSAATGFPLCFRVRRQGETERDNYDYMLRFMFQHRFTVGAARDVALEGIVFCSDRGYWKVPVMLLILGLSGTIFGTLMRSYWAPYTYDQPKERRGKREMIDTNKGRSCFIAYGRWKDSLLKFMAYRSGTGQVSLAMNSDCDEDDDVTMELVFANNGDERWYKDDTLSSTERILKAFQPVDCAEVSEEDADNIKFHLTMLPVMMLTCADLDLVWFILRMFSFTSSSTEAVLQHSAPYIPHEFPQRASFENVLGYAGHDKLMSTPTPANADDMSLGSTSSDGVNAPINAQLVSKIMKLMARPTQQTVDNCAKDANRTLAAINDRSNIFPATQMREILIEFGFSRQRATSQIAEKDMKKHIRKWITSITSLRSSNAASTPDEDNDSDNDSSSLESSSISNNESNDVVCYKFPYDMLTAAEVECLLLLRAGNKVRNHQVPGPHPNPTKKDQRIEALQFMDTDSSCDLSARQRGEDHDPLRDSVLYGAISKAYLQPKQNSERSKATLGHQNEALYLEQYRRDSENGKVPGVNIIDIQKPGMAMKEDSSYIRDSADGIAFERKSGDEDGDVFDTIKSHLVECKCRSSSKYDGSLMNAKSIRRAIARKIGIQAEVASMAQDDAVYMRVSSSDRELLQKLIPNKSERIQILHHAFTYGRDTTTLLVGDAQGRILYGLIVTFEAQLLADYGMALAYLYENGLNLFYLERVDDMPLKLFDEIVQSNVKLRRKYTLDDIMTSLLIVRELIPGIAANVKYPIPACNKLLPLDYSLWNVSKGGSDTTTRYTWNCKSILPIKTPQTTISSREFMIYGVLFHRPTQAVTARKKPDPSTDTIQSVRQRNNQRFAFHNSLRSLVEKLLRSAAKHAKNEQSSTATVPTENDYAVAAAPRFDPQRQTTRVQRDHSILGSIGSTGATPVGRGKSKIAATNHTNYDDLVQRYTNCTGNITRIYRRATDGEGFVLKNGTCDLCGQKNIITMCVGCKRVLCFDKDRSSKILARLRGNDPLKAKLLRENPSLVDLSRGDVPPFYVEVGEINGQPIIQGRSCYHIAHTNLCTPCNTDEQEDYQLAMIVASSSSSSDASPTRAHWLAQSSNL